MLSNNIRSARLKKGLSQKELCEEYNKKILEFNSENNTNYRTVGRTTITHWEKGRYTPETTSIPFLSDILNVSANELLDIDRLVNKKYNKELISTDNFKVSIELFTSWNNLSSNDKKEILDSIIEEAIKQKKEC